MDLPLLIPVPPSTVRKTIPNEEWEATLDAWIILTELRLHLSSKDFQECVHGDRSNASFLLSYFAAHDDPWLHGSSGSNANTATIPKKAKQLRRTVFLLTRRYYLDAQSSSTAADLLDWQFLGDFSECYYSSSALKQLLLEVWLRNEDKFLANVEKAKSQIMLQLSKNDKLVQQATADLVRNIRRLSVLASTLPHVGYLLMTGSDYVDSLYDAYRMTLSANSDANAELLRNGLVANIYVGLTSLLKVSKPNLSLLLDQLFTLKVSAGVGETSGKKAKLSPELLSDLVCSTDILVRIERYLVSAPQKRGQDLVSSLRGYQQEMKFFHQRHYQRHKRRKDKGKAKAGTNGGPTHIHKMSFITQIRDLFPDLGSGYVVRLLDYYDDNVETIVAHLLEGSLAAELEPLDKSESLPDENLQVHNVLDSHHTPPHLKLPRIEYTRNIDLVDDEIIQAARSETRGDAGVQKKKLLFGRANVHSTADSILADRSQHAENKAAILSALANFDSDDDERDDTYDVADVGGTVDAGSATNPADTETEQEKRARGEKDITDMDMTLYRIWKSSPTQFARDSTTRRSQPRAALKRETGMTDEAIEGWALVLQRDTKKQSRLEGNLSLESGLGTGGGAAVGQPELASTAYRKPNGKPGVNENDDIENDNDTFVANGRGRGSGNGGRGGPGRGGPNRGRGGGRGRGANHRRRDQHAKKMVKAGVLPS